MREKIPILASSARQLADSLRAQLQQFESRRLIHDPSPISSGCRAFDRLLPSGGFSRGSLIECLGGSVRAGGAAALAMILARQAAFEGGAIVILDHRRWFYPPAAAVLGIDLAEVLVVRADRRCDQIWALDQSLRCSAVAAVWAPWDHLEQLEQRDFRRLQLAAEQGGGLGLFIRPSVVRKQPSWSDIQLLVHPQPNGSGGSRVGRRLRIEITRCRRGQSGGTVDLEIDEVTGAMHQVSSHHETRTLHPAAKLADPASGGRSARA